MERQFSNIQYIGLNGHTTAAQLNHIMKQYEHCLTAISATQKQGWAEIKNNLRVIAGLIMNYKSVIGLQDPGFVAPRDIPDRFIEYPGLLRAIHYCDPQRCTQWDVMEKLINESRGAFDVMQFNMVWPQKELVERFKNRYPNKMVILQICGEALKNLRASEFVYRVRCYAEAVDFVLFDESKGNGVELNSSKLFPYIHELQNSDLEVGISVAGGLNSHNLLQLVRPITKFYPNVSVDAYSGLFLKNLGRREFKVELAVDFVKSFLFHRASMLASTEVSVPSCWTTGECKV